jgi:hypothetical protein
MFASAKVPTTFATIGLPTQAGPVPMAHSETLVDVESEEGPAQVEMRMCPICPVPTPRAVNPFTTASIPPACRTVVSQWASTSPGMRISGLSDMLM